MFSTEQLVLQMEMGPLSLIKMEQSNVYSGHKEILIKEQN